MAPSSHVLRSLDAQEFDPVAKTYFLSSVQYYLEHSSNRHDFHSQSIAIEHDPAIRQMFHFLAILEKQFGLSFGAVLSEDSEQSYAFVVAFADAYADAVRNVAKLLEETQTHHHPAGLHPTDKSQFRNVHVFTDLLSTFLHYGQKRGEAEENRPYKKGHIDEVVGFLRSYCEPLATSVLVACRLHDIGEDFDHPDGFIVKAGFSPDRKDDFFTFLSGYLDAYLPPINYPEFFRNLDLADDLGRPLPKGVAFDVYASKKLHHSDTLRDLSKIQGKIPGYAKDRYRDVNAKFHRILLEPDPRIRMIMFVQYFLPKAFDTLSNVYSYFQMSTGQSDKEKFKRRQMEGMVRNVVLRGMQQLGVHIAHYKIDDALRFPGWDDRQKYERMIQSIADRDADGGGMSRSEIFERDLFHMVSDRYQHAYKEPLPKNSFEIIMWRRAINDIKTGVQKSIESGVLPDETKFMHVIDIRVLDPRSEIAQRTKAIIESVIAGFAPILERRKLVAERRHPLVGELCTVRSDEGVSKKTTSFGYIVYSLRTLAEARTDLEGLVSATYLNKDNRAFHKLDTFLNMLRAQVGHIENGLRTIEHELRFLAAQPVVQQIDTSRSQIYAVIQYFKGASSQQASADEHTTIFGEKMSEVADMRSYAQEVMKLYHDYKEQVMTHMLPRIALQKFSVIIDGQRQVAPTDVTLPRDANPLYALFYYFPTDAQRGIKSIRVNRGGTQNIFSDVEIMKSLTLLPGDKVEIQLLSGQKDRKNIEKALRFARRTLYPDKDLSLA